VKGTSVVYISGPHAHVAPGKTGTGGEAVKTWDAVARTWASGAQRHAGAIRIGWNALAKVIEGVVSLFGLANRLAQAVSRLLASTQARCARVAAAARYRGQLPPAPTFLEDTTPLPVPIPVERTPPPAPFLVAVPTPSRSTPPPLPPELRQPQRRQPLPTPKSASPPPRPAALPRPRPAPPRSIPKAPARVRVEDPTDPDLTQRTRNPLIPPVVLPPLSRQDTLHGRGRKYPS
jgi:hypothetical protein